MNIIEQLAKEFSLALWQVKNTVDLIDEGATIPFIARYRKEVTGSLDDNVLRDLSARLIYLNNLNKRKLEVIESIQSQDQMTDLLHSAIMSATALVEVEDLYRPYRPKRRTRASIAREKGLEALAAILINQDRKMPSPQIMAKDYINPEKGVDSIEDALAGARDIIAEDISDNADIRAKLRLYLLKSATIKTVATKDAEDSVYSTYYDYEEPVSKIPGHRVLAINRGEREGFLKVSLECDIPHAYQIIYGYIIKHESPAYNLLQETAQDSFSRLIFPSLDNEVRTLVTDNAADSAIRLFSVNLHQLLMQPPIKDRVVLGLDPAYRTGCKIAVVDQTGKVLDTTVIYPTPPQSKVQQAEDTLAELIKRHGVSVISIGNGTASKESELFVAKLIEKLTPSLATPLAYCMVSEAGASVYSASKLAAEEFPQYDVSLRSAISIARRIQDPLAELVKIDPKAIGVGQYQHDMQKQKLDQSLGGVVEDCVNSVGVDLNTASHSLLSYIAGINSSVAKNIVVYREENGRFNDRKELLKVPKLGKKAFEQAAGFLRVKDGKNILDNTAVHPESYSAAKTLLQECGFSLKDIEKGAVAELKTKLTPSALPLLAEKTGVGVPTLVDIVQELLKPGRDPRDTLPIPTLRTDVLSISDLTAGMELEGTVRNVIDFGAFVDIGVHQDGLVHISQLSDNFVKHPLDVVKVGDVVNVTVLSVDEGKKRISLTMKRQVPVS